MKDLFIFFKKPEGDSAIIGYYAPDFEMDRFEHYEGFSRGSVLLMEGERLQFSNDNTDFSLLVRKIWETSARVTIEGLEGLDDSIIKYRRTGFVDGIEVGVSPGWRTYVDKIMFKYLAQKDYSVKQRFKKYN